MENTNYSNVNKAKIILTSIITGIINILIVIAMPMLSADFVLGPWLQTRFYGPFLPKS